MEVEGLLEAARCIRPYLSDLIGPQADSLDEDLATLLAAAHDGQDVAEPLRSLLSDYTATEAFLTQVLEDAPRYRPPQLHWAASRGGPQPLAGDIGPILYAGSYACPQGDYVWYRPEVGEPVPPCPTHGIALVRR
ncbi:hypothetical protein [Streptomyces sp. S.PB5]|uniref:hypothetical protein n=1 Tax=Streptomyces sp. S.PB5 TaxID=3020844 RepID=UPI0025B0E885|nr:hypothetical protein [Streptomyces sp. S.PB5]MDN3024996.1 hypothetical protein [Streptomyces sp. S.PB5]